MEDTQASRDGDFSPGCSQFQEDRSNSSEPSCVSMKSNWSMGEPIKFDGRHTSPDLSDRSISSEPSCVSMKSNKSMDEPVEFEGRHTSPDLSEQLTDTPGIFRGKHMPSNLSHGTQLVQSRFKSNLRKKFECLYEGTATQGNPTLLNKIYTELYITESESGEINNEHEVRQIETQSRRAATEDTTIKCNDIFRPLPGQDKPIRTVLTKGVAGIGKTVSVQKFIVDWAEEKENQDVQLIFPLPFREINLMKDKTQSLSDLLHVFFPETKEMEISIDEYKVLFIFDGLDECRLSLNFKSKVKLCNISESASVDVLLMNLIEGNLLPSALIWITSRPAAADLIPSECVHRVTEVRGFNEPQKQEYFRKRVSDQSLANTIISHLKSSRRLHIMCHIPVFCWISAAVLEKMLSRAESGEIPKTLTQMYTHFLILQTNIKQEKDYEKKVKDEDMILKLGKLAFEQLVKGNLIFYEKDLRECGNYETEASVYSGLCTQIFREEFGLNQGKVFCFVHLSIQEHLAALYAHLSFTKNYINVFDQTKQSVLSKILNWFKYHSLSELHQRAVDEALLSKNGHLDLFLHFLLGLSMESNQTLLRELLTQTGSCSYKKEETVEFIKQKIRENRSPERSINLFHCLNELGDDSLMQEIQDYLRSGQIGETKLSSSQWSALVYVLLTSEQKMDEFNLKQFIGAQNTADEVLQKLLPVIKESRSVQLRDCGVTDEGCVALASALRSNPSHLRDLDLTGNEIKDLGVKQLSDLLQDPRCKLKILSHNFQLIQRMLTLNLRKKFECLYEGTAMQRNPTLLNKIYTELYITESESGEINNEHEVRQIETQSRRAATEDTAIKCNDIFTPLPGQDKPIRTVLTKGVAGIGKTVSVQKFILDWSEEKENQDVQLIFPLPFREINLMKDKTLSLSDLLHDFFPETKEMKISSDEYKVLFIFDGLDECRLSLDFKSKVKLCNLSESASVDVLLMNLIEGNLLPSALIWITSRPAAADLIPSEFVHRVTEVRGFNDPQKQEYFRKRVSDQSLSNTIISHLKSSRSLYIMCHIPVFCWISAAVLEKMLSRAESGEIPKTLTQMYTHFLILQTNIKQEKDYEKNVKDEDMILKLGKLAFEQLVKGNLIFYEEDLIECGIDVTEASVYSGLCTQIFREEFGLNQGKVFCFVHLSIQEHLAALYAHLSFTKNYINVFDQTKQSVSSKILNQKKNVSVYELHQRVVDEALQSKNGHLDLFLRFLLGLSMESNQTLLRELLTQTGSCSYKKEETVEFIKQKIRENRSPERSINLFHCLNELGDDSLMQEIQDYLRSGQIGKTKLSSSQWSALVYVLLTSGQKMDEFNLKQFIGAQNTADEVLQKLLPVIKESRSVQLSDCGVTDEGCAALASALRSNPSHLRELDLTENEMKDLGVKQLSDLLQDPRCKLKILRLSYCGVTDEGCAALASAVRSNPSHLRELDLSGHKLGASGVNLLSDGLKDPRCKLEKLWLSKCGVTDEGCAALASALRSNPSHLRYLHLSGNKLGASGVNLLSDGLKDPRCKLEILRLSNCGVTDEGCAALASALRSNPSHLRYLDLSGNNLGASGVNLLSNGLKDPRCKLEKLWLMDCGVTDEGCAALASALRSNPSHLRELYLSFNKLGASAVNLLSDGLKDPCCKLETLGLRDCGVTDEGCAALASALRSNPSHLRELDLSFNKLGASAVNLLSDGLKDPRCKLEKLWLWDCGVTDEGCAALASALRSNPSHLRELDLSFNKLGASAVNLLSDGLKDPRCKLEKLWLWDCGVTYEGCAALASSLRSNPSHLIYLSLSFNKLGASAVNLLSDLLKDPRSKLEKLW
ncbi:NLR family CARD domain-containing protein 3-like isoform X5 [Onychostoma macrolepis]|uniref:NLR family CARD domain-containing protein 3-like isoform X5 n=1 Tax=Onychostoma macrolepis TaxID=369639 RepID=UPI00272D1155|nr:NLR family CARD domain-containing protein 3-like isoform X5 [Onychostoma macrolepis]